MARRPLFGHSGNFVLEVLTDMHYRFTGDSKSEPFPAREGGEFENFNDRKGEQ
jgi:hypothetical protein